MNEETVFHKALVFFRRHRGASVAGALLLLALLAGIGGTTWGLVRAEKRLAQLEKGNRILDSIFEDLHPDSEEKEGKPLRVLLGERLDRASKDLEGDAVDDPLVVGRLQVTLGRSQLALGYPDKAIALFSSARETTTQSLGPDHPDTLRTTAHLARAYQSAGQLQKALALFAETLQMQKTNLGEDHPETLTTMRSFAAASQQAGKHQQALALRETIFKQDKARLGPEHPDTIKSSNDLALNYKQTGNLKPPSHCCSLAGKA
jgi:tetratricopeptide (TPR) repeat protein